MAAAWWVQSKSGNSGWVDAIWSFGTGAVALVGALVAPGEPWHWRQIVVAILVACWSLRLGLHIATRTRAVTDDPRYRRLITQWGSRAPQEMFWFLQKQAMASVPLVTAVSSRSAQPRSLATAAGHCRNRAADHRAASVRPRRTDNCVTSNAAIRHLRPSVTWGFGAARAIPIIFLSGWPGLPTPSLPSIWLDITPTDGWRFLPQRLMYWLLVHVSGIPLLEEHMAQTRGEAFREYQRTTPAFFPRPTRTNTKA